MAKRGEQSSPKREDNPPSQIRKPSRLTTQPATAILLTAALPDKQDSLLNSYAHSLDCYKNTCTPLCKIFKQLPPHNRLERHTHPPGRLRSYYTRVLWEHITRCSYLQCSINICSEYRAALALKTPNTQTHTQ